MRIRVLGAVDILVDGRSADAGPPQQRHILSILAVEAGRSVPAEILIDRLWDDHPPSGSRPAIHAYIARIRRLLARLGAGEQRPARALRHAGGYLLDAGPDDVDVHQFHRLIADARGPDRDEGERARSLSDALALWRGEPLTGFTGQWAVQTRAALRQQHVDAIAAWTDATLRSCDPTDVVSALSNLIHEYPFAETLTAALMRALAASGRTADALEHYRAARQRLVDELGVEPGPLLRAAHEAVLRGEPTTVCARSAPPRRDPIAAPAQLPAPVSGFAGRAEQLARLDFLLATATRDPAAGMVICAVSGMAGVGKTAFAVHWAHRVAARFPDGQLYANLRGFDPAEAPTPTARTLHAFLDALGVPAERRARSTSTRRWVCSAPLPPGNACRSCWTTPATPTRSGPCYPVRRRHWSW